MASIGHRPHCQVDVLDTGIAGGPSAQGASSTRYPSYPAKSRTVPPHQAPRYRSPGLTDREITVLKVWLACDSKADVGARLDIALGTVNTHLTRIRDKYSRVGRAAPSKAALVARALQDGIVTLDDL